MQQKTLTNLDSFTVGPWEKYRMALDDVTVRLERITKSLHEAGVPYALVGGQAVAIWVPTCDPAAVRPTKDRDVFLHRHGPYQTPPAARGVGPGDFDGMGVRRFLRSSEMTRPTTR